MPPLTGLKFHLVFGSTKMPRLRRYVRAGSPLPAERPNAKTGAHEVPRLTITYKGFSQRARDWRMISSNSALDSPPPKVKVPVRCFQSSGDRP